MSPGIAKVATRAHIATPEQNSSFIQKYTNQLSAMMFRLQAIAQEEYSVLLPMLIVSSCICTIFNLRGSRFLSVVLHVSGYTANSIAELNREEVFT